jgi:hypothetical protein
MLLPVPSWSLPALIDGDDGDEHQTDWSRDYIDSFWRQVHPGWEPSYVIGNLVLIRTIAEELAQGAEPDNSRSLIPRYVLAFFGDDEAWTSRGRSALVEVLGRPAWADRWRMDLLDAGYVLALEAARAGEGPHLG